MSKEEIENRIKELDAGIVTQGQYVQQMNNQILMFHGAKEELNVWLKKLSEAEKIAQDKIEAEKKTAEDAVTPDVAAPALEDNQCGEANNENTEL